MGTIEEISSLWNVQRYQAWIRRNTLEEREIVLSLMAADLAQLGKASGEQDMCSNVKDIEQIEGP